MIVIAIEREHSEETKMIENEKIPFVVVLVEERRQARGEQGIGEAG